MWLHGQSTSTLSKWFNYTYGHGVRLKCTGGGANVPEFSSPALNRLGVNVTVCLKWQYVIFHTARVHLRAASELHQRHLWLTPLTLHPPLPQKKSSNCSNSPLHQQRQCWLIINIHKHASFQVNELYVLTLTEIILDIALNPTGSSCASAQCFHGDHNQWWACAL